jgi:hypothetical protein
MNGLRILLVATIAGSILGQSSAQRARNAVDLGIVPLGPADFPMLPRRVAAELQRRGCSIPQVPMVNVPHNVIKGQFAKPGQTDWAVLCSVSGVSLILILWNGAETSPTEIAPTKDADRLQSWTAGKMVYSRKINPVGKSFIMEHYNAYGGEKPPPIDHQGIEDSFYGKASEVLYLYRGKWLRLNGAD